MTEHGLIFLSYRTIEADFALRLAADLKNAGVQLWMDRLDIKPGDNWRLSIEEAVDTCAAMVVVLSPDYVSSKYCRRELARGDTRACPVFPVLLRAVSASDWPMEVQSVQYVDFRDWRDERIYQRKLNELLKQLQRRVPAQLGEIPDLATRYLTSLIAELEARKGVLEYVELAAQADAPSEEEPVRPEPRVAEIWGLDGEFALLETSAQEETKSTKRRLREKQRIRLESILEAVHQHPCFVLIGEAGAGKTTTLRRLALDAARARLENSHTAPLPLLLYLPTWRDEATPQDLVRAHWPFASDLVGLLAAGGALLYLDGLNEMGADGPRKAKLLREWLHSDNAPQHVIITCRIADYVGELDLDLPTVLAEEMDELRIQQFVINYLEDDAKPFLARVLPEKRREREDARHLFRLARNPYMLTALMVVYKSSPDGDLPHNSGALFQRLARALWERERQRRTSGWVPFKEMEATLSQLAFDMICEDQPIDVAHDYALGHLSGEALLRAGSSANFLEVRGKRVRFYHQLIQEYFAAVKLDRVGLSSVLVAPQFASDGRMAGKWDQVIVALCGLVPDADIVVHDVLATDPYLAATCIASGIKVAESVHRETVRSLLNDLRDPDARVQDLAAAHVLDENEDIAGLEVLDDLFAEDWEDDNTDVSNWFYDLYATDWEDESIDLLDYYVDGDLFQAVRRAASEALGQVGNRVALPGLLDALGDADERVRYAAASVLGRIGNNAAVPALIDALRDADEGVQEAAARALGSIASIPAIEGLLDALGDEDLRWAVEAGLESVEARAVPGLVEALNHQNSFVRWRAARLLIQFDWQPPDVQTELVYYMALDKWDRCVSLGAMAVPGLIKALSDADEYVSESAAYALVQIGSAALTGLREALRSGDSVVKQTAADALGEIGNFAAVPDLLNALNDKDWQVRWAAADALGRIGDASAVSGLRVALQDEDASVRQASVTALEWIEDPTAVQTLLVALHNEDAEVRQMAAEALGRIGDAAAQSGLFGALEDDDIEVRQTAVAALGWIGDPAAVLGLVEVLHDGDTDLRWTAAEALREIGTPESLAAVEEWRRREQDGQEEGIT